MRDRPLSIDLQRPLVLKANELFLVCRQDGSIPLKIPGMGLFMKDCRYLSSYGLSIGGSEPLLLAGDAEMGDRAAIEFTNAEIARVNGVHMPQNTVGVRRTLSLGGRHGVFSDHLEITNFTSDPVPMAVALTFSAGFEDLFVLRGEGPASECGTHHPPQIGEHGILYRYDGIDGVVRWMRMRFSERPHFGPATVETTAAHFYFSLGPRECRSLVMQCHLADSGGPPDRAPIRGRRINGGVFASLQGGEHRLLDRALRRAVADLRLLRIRRDGERFLAAGIPWFVALFGRDGLIPALQVMAVAPAYAEGALRALARRQGTRTDPGRGEEPGKILHELRVGELANAGRIGATPSFRSVGSTCLFLLVLAREARWSGSLRLFRALRPQIEAALGWLDRHARPYVTYRGPPNQGWKDSEDGILRGDGSCPGQPIALAEVQGYVHAAWLELAELFERDGESAAAERLRSRAEGLAEAFRRDFWWEEEGCAYLGLEEDGRPIKSVSSNAAQALFGGILDEDRARRTVARMMRADMFSGWGVRTLSTAHPRFDPYAYHLGSVWPFDNSLIVDGFCRYGAKEPASRIFEAQVAASGHFTACRLPEFFAGVERRAETPPARCPRADPLQAWSVGSLPLMLTSLLGLQPDGFERRLRVVRPVLPPTIGSLDIPAVRVAGATVSLHFHRQRSGRLSGEVSDRQGDLDVIFED